MLILGVDIGVSGAIAVFDEHGHYCEVFDLPTMELGKSKKRLAINAGPLRDTLMKLVYPTRPALAYVEQVHAMPMNGAIGAFSQGHSLGTVTAVLACLGIPYLLIAPPTWKKHYGLVRAEKDASRGVAIRLFPSAPLSRKKDVDRAEACLIGAWGVQHGNTAPFFVQ